MDDRYFEVIRCKRDGAHLRFSVDGKTWHGWDSKIAPKPGERYFWFDYKGRVESAWMFHDADGENRDKFWPKTEHISNDIMNVRGYFRPVKEVK